ncbi:TIGR01440 family protein [Thalassobacillus sp. CUG 92003]|uniref:TIGR01440 family protein n=1 Tax=Thalassobacillus sp. CUG 92003 TaxID=2736641 RepID=UPI0015E67F81|nr:TIGR01440 family protein [Thalassobacillus sp. CUG 92003]
MVDVRTLEDEALHLLDEIKKASFLKEGDLFVVGCSTSEVAGSRIGTSGSEEIAKVMYAVLNKLKEDTGIEPIFQCCEHLNRALLMERHMMKQQGYEEVSAVPVPKAGGSMASYAYKQLQDPVLVESVKGDAGIDIGDTLIGMHLKQVAVPVRISQRHIGSAHVNIARTRPRLIGGERASYEKPSQDVACD